MIEKRCDGRRRALAFLGALALVTLLACQDRPKLDPYVQEIERWHQKRVAALTKPDGWLSLAGLYWLHEGVNRFGSSRSNDVVFPPGKAPDYLGSFILRGDSVHVRIWPGAEVRLNGEPVTSRCLRSDADGKPDVLTYRSLIWYVIKRGGRYAIRLKDRENPALRRFRGIARFPVDTKWRLPARFDRFDSARMVEVPTAVGTVARLRCPGKLVFQYQGRTYGLLAAADPGDTTLFVIFADLTNEKETYGAGRFLEVPWPNAHDSTVVDFNKAYNPPCAFTPYATCPLPPDENRLPFRVTAGEKRYGGGH